MQGLCLIPAHLEVADLARLRLHELLLPAGLFVRFVELGADDVYLLDQLADADIPLGELVLEAGGIVAEDQGADFQAARLFIADDQVAFVGGTAVLLVEIVYQLGPLDRENVSERLFGLHGGIS